MGLTIFLGYYLVGVLICSYIIKHGDKEICEVLSEKFDSIGYDIFLQYKSIIYVLTLVFVSPFWILSLGDIYRYITTGKFWMKG